VQLVRRGVFLQLDHVLGLDRAEATDEHRNLDCSTGSIPELTRENRPQQTVVAGDIAALGSDVADLPADHLVVPQRDGLVLYLIGRDQVFRDGSREIGQGLAVLAGADEVPGDLAQPLVGQVLFAVVVAQAGLPEKLLHCQSTVAG